MEEAEYCDRLMLIASHDLDLIRSMGHRVLRLRAGRLDDAGPPEQVA
jgi:ABC-type ATPase involved in cell division